MEMSRYNINCQKAFHKGLQYAKGFGHQFLEVEHVALAMVRSNFIILSQNGNFRVGKEIEKSFSSVQRLFGNVQPKFGIRLDQALDVAENGAEDIVDELELWNALCRYSTTLKLFQEKEKQISSVKVDDNSLTELGEEKRDNLSYENRKKGEFDSSDNHFKISKKHQKLLGAFTLDLSAMAENGELDPVIGRETEVRRVLEILGRKKKNNPVLIGEAGVGKTAIAEALAIRISEGQVPESMKSKRILSLDLPALLAGAKYRGEFEERIKGVIEVVKSCQGSIILFVDEIHMLVGAGAQEGSTDAANILKPELARGSIRCFGATTFAEYRKFIEKDPALERRFQPITVEEPDESVTLAILRGLKNKYEVHHGVVIEDDALVASVQLSKRYLTQRKFPDKAVDLLDEACSRVRFQIDSMPASLEEIANKLSNLELEKQTFTEKNKNTREYQILEVQIEKIKIKFNSENIVWKQHQQILSAMKEFEKRKQENIELFEKSKSNGDYEFASKMLNSEIPRVEKDILELKDQLQKLYTQYSWLKQEVNADKIEEVVSLWSLVPLQKIREEEAQTLLSMEERIQNKVFGQEKAINVVTKAIKRTKLGINDPNRPQGVFLFCGPTGVGKTETVKALSEEIFGDANRMIRFDMSEFMEKHTVARLIGAPPGYVGYGEGGELTEAVKKKPYSVILLDEIEKANPKVYDVLLQVFEDGRLTDGMGKTIDFRNTLIVMTSNLYIPVFVDGDELQKDEQIRLSLTDRLKPEFVNRIDEIIIFEELGNRHYRLLLNRLTGELNSRLYDKGVHISLSNEVIEKMIVSVTGGQFGGRALRRIFQSLVVDTLSGFMLENKSTFRGALRLLLNGELEPFWEQDTSLHKFITAQSTTGS